MIYQIFSITFGGGSLALHLELDDSSQADFEVIKTKLQEVFSDGPFSAFAKL